jgi:hypothetical protein
MRAVSLTWGNTLSRRHGGHGGTEEEEGGMGMRAAGKHIQVLYTILWILYKV